MTWYITGKLHDVLQSIGPVYRNLLFPESVPNPPKNQRLSLQDHNAISVYQMSIVKSLHNKSNSLSAWLSFSVTFSITLRTVLLEKNSLVCGSSIGKNNTVRDFHNFNLAKGVYQQSRSYNLHEGPQMYHAQLYASPWPLQSLEVHPLWQECHEYIHAHQVSVSDPSQAWLKKYCTWYKEIKQIKENH